MFHAVPGKILNSDDLKCGEKIEMFNGDSSRTKCINSAMYQNGAGNTQLKSSPQIIQTDIKFCMFLSKAPAFAFVFSIGTLPSTSHFSLSLPLFPTFTSFSFYYHFIVGNGVAHVVDGVMFPKFG